MRLNDLLNKANELTGTAFTDYYSARSFVLKSYQGDKYLAKCHYIYDPRWLKIDMPLYSHGILYAVGKQPSAAADVPKYPADYRPGDILSCQLLTNLDLARGERYLKEEPYDTARADGSFNLALKRLENKNSAAALNNLGIFYRHEGYLQLAFKAYALALKKPVITKSLRRDIVYNLSNIYKDNGNNFLAAGKYTEALGSFQQASKFDPDNAELLLNISLLYLRALHDTTSAKTFFKKYLNLRPADDRVSNLLKKLQ